MNKTRIAMVLGILVISMMMVSPATAKKDKDDKCVEFYFLYDDGHVDEDKRCDTKNDIEDDIHVNSLHVSCSDEFENGEAKKSDLDGHKIVKYSITWYDGDEIKKQCGEEFGEVPVFGSLLASGLAIALGALAYVGVRRRK